MILILSLMDTLPSASHFARSGLSGGYPVNVSFSEAGMQTPANFSIIALPDTQYYSAIYPEIFDNQTQWIADSAESMDIVFVTHEGDIVDNRSSFSQWNNANNSMSRLDACNLPYGISPGNHDESSGDLTNYNMYFNYNRYSGQSWYGGAYQNDNSNSYELFQGGQDDYLIFHFQYQPSDQILAWANDTLQNFPNRRVIVTTHSYLNVNGNRTTIGQRIWENFIAPHADQIFLVLCGHISGEAERTDTVDGHTVYQLLADYQGRANGGTGWLRILQFCPAEDKILVKTYSPHLNSYETDADSQFTISYGMTSPGVVTVPDDYSTIQEAINKAYEGDTVFVRNGIYRENVVLNKTVSLVGEAKDTTVIDGAGVGHVVYITSNDTTVANFTIQNGGYGKSDCGLMVLGSFNVSIINNNIIYNNGEGLNLAQSSHCILRNNNIGGNTYWNFGVTSEGDPRPSSLEYFLQDIDSSNTVNGKPIQYLVNISNIVVNPARTRDAGYVGIINSTNVTVENYSFSDNSCGVLFAFSQDSVAQNMSVTHTQDAVYAIGCSNVSVANCSLDYNWHSSVRLNDCLNCSFSGISGIGNAEIGLYWLRSSGCSASDNVAGNTRYGMWLDACSNCSLSRNTAENCWDAGIWLDGSNNCTVFNNAMENNYAGIRISGEYNMIYCNNIINNYYGFDFAASWFNTVFHNNLKNAYQFSLAHSSGSNIWDAGYPSGGNYWGNNAGVDLFNGPYQNETGSDGISDIPYVIDSDNLDRYPLMSTCIPGSPVVYFTYLPMFPLVGETVTFNASASMDYDGSIVSYAWDFGDSNTSTGTSPIITHVYASEGIHVANLTVTDDDGFGRSVTRSITVVQIDSISPETLQDYDGSWRTTDFTIRLTATDNFSGVAETYYKINDAQTKTLKVEGQPLISTESANSTLEYWSVDNAGNEENHHILTGIKLDKTAPTGSIIINEGENCTTTTTVILTLSATDATSGIAGMRFSNDNTTYTEWQTYTTSTPWIPQRGDGIKAIFVQFKNKAGLVSTYSGTIILDTAAPVIEIPSREPAGEVQPNQSVKVSVNVTDTSSQVKNVTLYYVLNNGNTWEEPTPMNHSPSTHVYEATIPGQLEGTRVRYRIVAFDQAGNNATQDRIGSYNVYQVVPEFPYFLSLAPFALATLLATIERAWRRKRKSREYGRSAGDLWSGLHW